MKPTGSRWWLTVALLLALAPNRGAVAQTPGPARPLDQKAPPREPQAAIHAARASKPPALDGRLTDEDWAGAEPVTGFLQIDPDEGKPGSEATEVRVLFDNQALYIGARMFDREPGAISRRMSSRDGDADADWIAIYLDPLHDHLTGVQFRVTASNVQRDTVVYNDTWQDGTWDAVWESAVAVDEAGWSAELRIPLSQLRFPASDRQTWGVNVQRFIRRKNETTWLELVRKNENGLASRMGHLSGLDGLEPTRHVELLPYTAGRNEFITPAKSGNPFNDGSRPFAAVGMDVKWGITSNFTLDGSINPDFGQVEVDPAVVNLTAFETFFDEKRPFFLEGAQIFNNYGYGGSNDFWGFNSSYPTFFYSRRIGRSPQVSAGGDFADAPSATTILGATKLTARTRSGWSMGLLEAVTERETAQVATAGVTSRIDVEPMTNYLVARLHKDIGRRAGLGFLTTSVTRKLDTAALADAVAGQASLGGVDGYLFLDRTRDWVIAGYLAGSKVTGSSAAIERLQRAAQRYYQRPDAPEVSFDPGRTSLGGYTGRISLNRNSGLLKVNATLWGSSPGFDSNDLGFHSTGDRGGAHAVLLWRKPSPDRFTRSRQFWIAKAWNWNFNRELQNDSWHSQASLTFLNYWNGGANVNLRRQTLDDRLTRGGPSAIAPAGANWNVYVNTDSRKWLSLSANTNYNWNEAGGWGRNTNVSVNLKPSPMLTVTTGPSISSSHGLAQYVQSVSDQTATGTFGGRYVFGTIDQTQLSLTTRVNLILSPRISIRVFAQPLIAAGDYSHFKELAAPRTFDFLEYDTPGATILYDLAARSYTADADADGSSAPFTFADPDFNFKSLRVNAVFRWEFKPGSTLYGVWTRQQQDVANPGSFALGRDAGALFSARGDDVFLVKLAYWLGR